MREPNGQNDPVVAEAYSLLAQTESALRRVLFEARPPALELPGGFEETIRDRISMLRSLTGVAVDKGCIVAERNHLPGHRLLSLNDRSLLAGGWTKIESEPGLRTKIEFWMPAE